MDRRKKRTTTKQYFLYISMMEKDSIFAKGSIPRDCNPNYMIKKWKELSNELNKCNNAPILTPDEWRKRLNDWKNTTRAKYRRSLSDDQDTTMTTLEMRALELFGAVPPVQISTRYKSKKGEDEEEEMEAIDDEEAEQHIVESEHDEHEEISPENTHFRSTLSSANADQIIYDSQNNSKRCSKMPKKHNDKIDRRRKRTSTEQYMMYIEMMEKDPIFATGKIPRNCKANYLIKKWRELSDELNTCNNGPILTSDEWRKRLTDWKNTTRARFRRSMSDEKDITMTTLEIRALDLFGAAPPIPIYTSFKSKKGKDEEEEEMEAIDDDEAEQDMVESEHDEHEDMSPDNTYFRSTLSSAKADQIIYDAKELKLSNTQQLTSDSTMDVCILCLEENSDVLDRIKVDSLQWQELNIQNLIEQHLWPIESATLSSYLCSTCWHELNDFHKFYTRIEEAQNRTLDSLVKIEIEPEETSIHELILQDLFIEEEKINIKEEPNEYLSEDDKPLMPCSQQEDPLNFPKKLKNSKRKNGKPESNKEPKIQKVPNTEQLDIKEDSNEIVEDSTSRDDSKTDSKLDPVSIKEMDKFITENFKITCSICEISFDNFDKMCRHYKMEHEQHGYAICCSKKFFKRTLLFEHLHKHLDPNYLKCDQCSREMATRSNLREHMKTHGPREKTHCCDVCGLRFIGRNVLETHKTRHLSEEEKLFPCLKCGKNFGTKGTLESHLKNVHIPRTISCDICGLIVANKSVILRHKSIMHSSDGNKKYPCPICSKMSKNIHALNTHIRKIHQKAAKHKCPMCPKAFKEHRKLKDHISTHTGFYAHTCTWCPKKFKSISNMQTHRRKSHPKEYEKEQRKKYVDGLVPNNITTTTEIVNDP